MLESVLHMYGCTVEPLYCGHPWDGKNALVSEVSYIVISVMHFSTCTLYMYVAGTTDSVLIKEVSL